MPSVEYIVSSDDAPRPYEQLDSLIAYLLEAEKRGEAFDGVALIEDHPDLADSLRKFCSLLMLQTTLASLDVVDRWQCRIF